MKYRSQVSFFLLAVILLGLIVLIAGFQNLGMDHVQLPQIYIKVFYFELVLIASISLLGLVGLVGISLMDSERLSKKLEGLFRNLEKNWVKWLAILSLGGIGFLSGQMLLQIPSSPNPLTTAFLLINRPFFIYLLILCLMSLLFISLRLGIYKYLQNQDVKVPILIFLLLLLIFVGIDLSGFGFRKDLAAGGSFRLTGFPILDYQLLFSWLSVMVGSLGFTWIFSKWEKLRKISPVLIDIFSGLLLFIGAFLIWNQAPIIANAFIDRPRPPNFQFYPNLDAVVYDRTALNLLATGKWQTYIGGFDSVGRRPLFSLYLAGLHALAGNDYSKLISLQVAAFSILPVLIYLFTKTLHNRRSGMLTAILIIIRNLNGVWLQEDVWGGTSLHMLMSDILAAIVVVFYLFLLIKILKMDGRNPPLALLVGGTLGLGALIRQELLVLLPIALLFILLKGRLNFRVAIGKTLLVTTGFILVILPWMIRNFVKTDLIFLDKPGKVVSLTSKTLKGIFSTSTGIEDPDVDIDQPVIQESVDLQELEQGKDELGILSLMINHYGNAIPQTVLYLPSNPVWASVDYLYRLRVGEHKSVYGNLFYSPYSYTKTLPYWWWDQWDGKIASQSWIYLGINIALISIGLYQSWKKDHWSVAVTILALAAIISVYVLILRSGGRFMYTVDWISVMLLSIGLIHLGDHLVKNLSIDHKMTDEKPKIEEQAGTRKRIGGWLFFILMLIVGSSPVIAEFVLPDQYPASTREKRLEELVDPDRSSLSGEEIDMVNDFLERGGEVIYGRALYPRFFPPDAALMTQNQTLFPASTTFTIAGPELNFVVLPRLQPPDWFPQGVETLVVGCRESSLPPDSGFACLGCLTDEFEALLVVLFNPGNMSVDRYWRDGSLNGDFYCPK